HIELVLGVKAGAKQAVRKSSQDKKESVKVLEPKDVKKQLEGVGAPKKDSDKNTGQDSGFLKKVFSRKTGSK
ncbi:MAG: hypothetical protein JW816_02080, partial [Candidatus Buchananbacteria bacterium]|nr:hypothetical protein [Candidatus Buchananbacteria bacterium]